MQCAALQAGHVHVVRGAHLQVHAFLSILEAQLKLQSLLPAGSQCCLQLNSAQWLIRQICTYASAQQQMLRSYRLVHRVVRHDQMLLQWTTFRPSASAHLYRLFLTIT